MQLITEIKSLFPDMSDLAPEDRDDIITDAQEYGLGEMIALVSEGMSEETLHDLETMIENEATVEDIDTRLAHNAPSYEKHIPEIVASVKDYLESEDVWEEEWFEVEEDDEE